MVQIILHEMETMKRVKLTETVKVRELHAHRRVRVKFLILSAEMKLLKNEKSAMMERMETMKIDVRMTVQGHFVAMKLFRHQMGLENLRNVMTITMMKLMGVMSANKQRLFENVAD